MKRLPNRPPFSPRAPLFHRVGIFGGSFNPVHLGHVGVARRVLAAEHLDLLYVVPACVSPFKTSAPPESVPFGFSPAVRLAFLRAAFAFDPRLCIWDFDLARGGVSYSIDLVRAVRARHPDAEEIVFVIGADAALGLARWKDWDTLKTLCRFVVAPRTRESSTEVRRRLAAGEDVAPLVPAEVLPLLRKALQSGEATLPQNVARGSWLVVRG